MGVILSPCKAVLCFIIPFNRKNRNIKCNICLHCIVLSAYVYLSLIRIPMQRRKKPILSFYETQFNLVKRFCAHQQRTINAHSSKHPNTPRASAHTRQFTYIKFVHLLSSVCSVIVVVVALFLQIFVYSWLSHLIRDFEMMDFVVLSKFDVKCKTILFSSAGCLPLEIYKTKQTIGVAKPNWTDNSSCTWIHFKCSIVAALPYQCDGSNTKYSFPFWFFSGHCALVNKFVFSPIHRKVFRLVQTGFIIVCLLFVFRGHLKNLRTHNFIRCEHIRSVRMSVFAYACYCFILSFGLFSWSQSSHNTHRTKSHPLRNFLFTVGRHFAYTLTRLDSQSTRHRKSSTIALRYVYHIFHALVRFVCCLSPSNIKIYSLSLLWTNEYSLFLRYCALRLTIAPSPSILHDIPFARHTYLSRTDSLLLGNPLSLSLCVCVRCSLFSHTLTCGT